MEATLDREGLLQLLHSIAPSRQDAISDQGFEAILDAFCAACPDPAGARWLLLDCLEPLSDADLVERALAMPARAKAQP